MVGHSGKSQPKAKAAVKKTQKSTMLNEIKGKVTKAVDKDSSSNASLVNSVSKAGSNFDPVMSDVVSQPFRFMDLPQNVRQKVYAMSGLVRKCPVHLNNPEQAASKGSEYFSDGEDDGVKPTYRSQRRYYPFGGDRIYRCITMRLNENILAPGEKGCNCDALPMQLMFVSKTVLEEVEVIFYSLNKFRVLHNLNLAVKVLNGLSSRAQLAITSIELGLGKLTNADFRKKDGMHADLAAFIEVATQKCYSSKLKLSLGADICGLRVQSREMFMAPFEKLSGLKRCIVHLEPLSRRENRLNPRFGELAQKIVSAATSFKQTVETKAFPFADLPRELRVQILTLSGLVIKTSKANPHDGLKVVDGHLHRTLVCCEKCVPEQSYHGACYCFGQKSIASSTCTCIRYPRALFLVSKTMHAEAREIFLAKNRFNFTDSIPKTMAFLRRSPMDMPHGLRFIDLAPLGDWCDKQGLTIAVTAKWVNFVQYLAQNACLSKIELSFHFGVMHFHRCNEAQAELDPSNNHWSNWEHRNRYLLYQAIRTHAAALKGLKSFKVFLPCDCLCETTLEKAVMGQDYNSKEFGKICRVLRAANPHELIIRPPRGRGLANTRP